MINKKVMSFLSAIADEVERLEQLVVQQSVEIKQLKFEAQADKSDPEKFAEAFGFPAQFVPEGDAHLQEEMLFDERMDEEAVAFADVFMAEHGHRPISFADQKPLMDVILDPDFGPGFGKYEGFQEAFDVVAEEGYFDVGIWRWVKVIDVPTGA